MLSADTIIVNKSNILLGKKYENFDLRASLMFGLTLCLYKPLLCTQV